MTIDIFFDEFGRAWGPEEYRSEHEIIAMRPYTTGNPIVRDKDKPFIIPKPKWLIDISFPLHGYILTARRLYNLLLGISWNMLQDANSDFVFAAYASDIRRAIGQNTAKDNSQLIRALQELYAINVAMPHIGGYHAPLLRLFRFEDNGEVVTWVFPPELREYLAGSSPWGTIDFGESLQLSSQYALTLYEHACLRSGLRHPVLNKEPEELRKILGAGEGLQDWQSFKSRALLPAIKQVNNKTKFNVSVTYEKSPRTGAIVKVKLRFGKKRKNKKLG